MNSQPQSQSMPVSESNNIGTFFLIGAIITALSILGAAWYLKR